jgi:hypothetical protein
MSATYDADVGAAAPPPKRRHRRYRRDVRSVADLDGRTRASRLARDLAARLRAELGADGAPTAAQGELITRCTMLSVLAGDAELKIARNEAIDIHGYVALVNCQRRALQVLGGFERDPKLIDGTTNSHADDARFQHVWPEYRAAEAARSASAADGLAKLIEQLVDDEPPKSDAEPEEPQS